MRSLRASACVLAFAALGGCGPARADPAEPAGGSVAPIRSVAPLDRREAKPHVGVLVPEAAVDVAPPAVAEVLEVLVAPGDRVAAGDVVATLDGRAMEEELAIAKAELRQHKAAASGARADVAHREATSRRLGKLAAAGHASAEELEDGRFAERRARSKHASAQAAVAESRARIDKIERQLVDTSLRAPFAGAVALRHRDAGSVAGPNAPVVRIVGSRSVCRFAVPPAEVVAFPPGRRVELRPESGEGSLPAVVARRSPEVDPASQLVFVDAELQVGPHAQWPIGTEVRVVATE